MENIEEQILSYPYCSRADQRTIEDFAEEHPEWAPLLDDVQDIEKIVQGAPAPEDMSDSDVFLATYVVMNHLHPDDVPPTLETAFDRLESRIQEEPGLNERVATLRRRLEAVEADVDPVAQFEELTDHTLSPQSQPEGGDEQSPKEDLTTAEWALLDQLFGVPWAVRWAGGAAVGLLVLYGALFVIGRAAQSPAERLAVVESEGVVENYAETNTRSISPTSQLPETEQRYLEARSALADARGSTLGLFPEYDEGKLARAKTLLEEVVDESDPDSFLALEAQFYLGKTYLANGQIQAARSRFQTVVEREGRLASEAQDILDTLNETYSSNEDEDR